MKRILALILVLVISCSALISCNDNGSGGGESTPDLTDEYGTGASEYATTRDTTGRNVGYVEICVEKYGKIVLLLDATTAPQTVTNFIGLVKAEFYNTQTDPAKTTYGNSFHVVDPGFVLQGGCPNHNGSGNLEQTVYGEFAKNGYYENDILHKKGVISMVRNDDPNSASCQFFITHADLEHLDGDYASFGYVIQGMSVIDRIMEDFVQYADTENRNIIFDYSKQPIIKYIKWLPDKDGYWASKHS